MIPRGRAVRSPEAKSIRIWLDVPEKAFTVLQTP